MLYFDFNDIQFSTLTRGLQSPLLSSTLNTDDPQGSLALHRCELLEDALYLGAFKEPEPVTVRSDRKDARTIQDPFISGGQTPRSIAQHSHGHDGRESLGGVKP